MNVNPDAPVEAGKQSEYLVTHTICQPYAYVRRMPRSIDPSCRRLNLSSAPPASPPPKPHNFRPCPSSNVSLSPRP